VLAGAWVGWRVVAQRRLDEAVVAGLAKADAVLVPAIALDRANQRARADAFAAFDAGTAEQGEELWARSLALAQRAEDGLQAAARILEDTVALAPPGELTRQRLADVLFTRSLLAERTRHVDL